MAQHTTIKSELLRMFSGRKRAGPQRAEFFEVLRGVDLEIHTGETVGIIGRNGSGKSTLLKLMTGIYGPTSGSIQSNGRISALLELGAGFHPDFSGRENVFVNGIILGLSRSEIRARIEEIIAFAELGEFIDEPVRTYSSGMFMRLAFAVATHVDPEILIIDEILAVGDDHFARKSMAKMTEFKKRGKTIVLVTHDLGTVQRWCDRAVWIHQGRVREVGNPTDVVSAYRREVAEAEFAAQEPAPPPATPADPSVEPAPPETGLPEVRLPEPLEGPRVGPERRWGNFRLELPRVRLLDLRGSEAHVLDTEDGAVLEMDWVAREPIEDVVFGVSIEQAGTGVQAYGTNTLIDGVRPSTPLVGRGKVSLQIDRLGLVSGDYLVDVAAHTRDNTNYDYQRQLLRFAVRSSISDVGVTRPAHSWSIVTQQGGQQ